MPLQNVRDEILHTLKDLGKDDFDEFCSRMTDPNDEPRIRAADVEHNSSRREIRNLLVSRCTEAGALDRTINILRAIGCNNGAMILESRTQLQSKEISSIVSESGASPEPLGNQASNVPKKLLKPKQVEHQADKAEVVAKASPAPPEPRVTMSINIIRGNKTSLLGILSEDRRLILQKVQEHKLITDREYRNLKGIYKEDEEGHIVELLDKIMGKGDETCQCFLDLLETDAKIKDTYPKLKSLQLSHASPTVTAPVQETCVMDNRDDGGPRCKKTKLDEPYPVNSIPRGICLILNNINFEDDKLKKRLGSEKDAESLGEVFSSLGFRVLMCEDQTEKEMSHILTCFSTLSDISELQKLSLKEWSNGFGDLQNCLPKHGDVFICCILSHGKKEVIYGTDIKTIPIKDVTRTFKSSNNSPLTGKPKIFLIQACQGSDTQRGVLEKDLETDEGSVGSVPEEADVLVAIATVENCASFRNTVKGSWFIQSLCQQLKEGCSRGDDIHSILQCVNSDVSQKEGSNLPGLKKQMPEIRYTLRKKLLLSPFNTDA